jgi:hypothetical protein
MSPAPDRLTRAIPADWYEQAPCPAIDEARSFPQPQAKPSGILCVRETRVTLREERLPQEGLR